MPHYSALAALKEGVAVARPADSDAIYSVLATLREGVKGPSSFLSILLVMGLFNVSNSQGRMNRARTPNCQQEDQLIAMLIVVKLCKLANKGELQNQRTLLTKQPIKTD